MEVSKCWLDWESHRVCCLGKKERKKESVLSFCPWT